MEEEEGDKFIGVRIDSEKNSSSFSCVIRQGGGRKKKYLHLCESNVYSESFSVIYYHFPPFFADIDDIEKSDKDEGYIPWAMGWVHTATNFVLS